MTPEARRRARWRIALALAIVYLVWGSTYAGIRLALGGFPPFLLGGSRFLVAGALLFLFASFSGQARPSRRQVRDAALIGVLLLTCGNGGVVWAEQHVPTGLAAILIATVPLWMVGLDALHPGGERLTPAVLLSVVLGLAGVVLLMGGGLSIGGDPRFWTGVLVLLGAAFAWAAGSIYGRYAESPSSYAFTTALEMLAGGAALTILGTLRGEWARLDAAAILGPPLWGQLYLVFFGSLLAFSAYVWLLRAAPPALVGTYAYVNPVVAILLGILIFGESLDVWTLTGSGVILGSVVLAQVARHRHASSERLAPPPAPHEPVPAPTDRAPPSRPGAPPGRASRARGREVETQPNRG